MGTVYRALDPVLERPVAIKTLNPTCRNDDLLETKTRFVLEAKSGRAPQSSQHHHDLRRRRVRATSAYIAMEYLEGQSLHS
jgi:serine/threonine-protein kinase